MSRAPRPGLGPPNREASPCRIFSSTAAAICPRKPIRGAPPTACSTTCAGTASRSRSLTGCCQTRPSVQAFGVRSIVPNEANCDDQNPGGGAGQGQAGVPSVDDPPRGAWEGHRVHRAAQAAAGLRSIYGTSAMVGERQVARRACRAQPVPLVRWRVSGISGAHSANHGPSGDGRVGPGFRSDPDRRSCAGQCLPRTARFAASELRRLNLPVTAWFKSVADRGACGPGGPGWW